MSTLYELIDKINNGHNSLFKESYGHYAVIFEEQTKRYTNLLHRFVDLCKTDKVELFSSPGRTEIGGNHTDHQLGHENVSTLERAFGKGKCNKLFNRLIGVIRIDLE